MKYLYETHMHTSHVSACASSTAAEQVRAYKKRGYTGIIVTDHFTNGYSTIPKFLPWKNKMKHFASGYEKAKKEGDICRLDIFFGWEFTYKGSDFLTYGLDLGFLLANPGLEMMGPEEYSAFVRKHGGFLAQAHPYRDDSYVENQFPVDYKLLDAVEVYNASMPERTNAKAMAFAERHGLPMIAGSDSHSAGIPVASGIKLDKRAENIFDIIEAVKNNKIGLIL